jgi:RimJ/RimL family protein N-acetyltransferase
VSLILQTPRLLVREFSLADAPALHLICGNRRTMRHVGDGTTLDLARCTEWIRVALRDYAGKGYGAWGYSCRARSRWPATPESCRPRGAPIRKSSMPCNRSGGGRGWPVN